MLVEHPIAAETFGNKVRQPYDFIAASLRAPGLGETELLRLDARRQHALPRAPLELMAQPWLLPPGPDGWPFGAAAHASRRGRFIETALADAASPALHAAAPRAKTAPKAPTTAPGARC